MNKGVGYVGCVVWAGLMVGVLSSASWANDKHFKNATDRTGCESLITRDGIDECKKVQAAKNTACNRSKIDRQEEWKKAYDELYKWWSSEGSKLPDTSFKSDKQRQMRELVDKLVAGRSAGGAGVTIANECITARTAVQKWFENVASPLADKVKSELVPMRRSLVDNVGHTKLPWLCTRPPSVDCDQYLATQIEVRRAYVFARSRTNDVWVTPAHTTGAVERAGRDLLPSSTYYASV